MLSVGKSEYGITLSTRAWSQIGKLPRNDFDAVRQAIAHVATEASNPGYTPPGTARAGEIVITLRIDDERQMVVVESLARDLEGDEG